MVLGISLQYLCTYWKETGLWHPHMDPVQTAKALLSSKLIFKWFFTLLKLQNGYKLSVNIFVGVILDGALMYISRLSQLALPSQSSLSYYSCFRSLNCTNEFCMLLCVSCLWVAIFCWCPVWFGTRSSIIQKMSATDMSSMTLLYKLIVWVVLKCWDDNNYSELLVSKTKRPSSCLTGTSFSETESGSGLSFL